jgi:hypothetical protein
MFPVHRGITIMAFFRALTLAAITASTAAAAGTIPERQRNTKSPRASTSSWEKYVRSPPAKIVKPASILSQNTTGNVTNANGMIDGTGPTVLSRSSDTDSVPSIVVDFGQNVVGIVSIDFAGSQNTTVGLPGLKVAFSETTQYLTDRSDFTWSDNASGVSNRSSCACKEQSADYISGSETHEWNGSGLLSRPGVFNLILISLIRQ